MLDEPEISDVKFDRMMEELKQLEAEHPELVTPDSPTQRVGGAPRKGFETRRHSPAMMSLDNTYSMEELDEFDRRVRELAGRERVDYVTEHKFDGLSISLIYEGGVLDARRHARRRHDRRRRHRECAHDPLDPAARGCRGAEETAPAAGF